jgi:hypothetical protein
LLRTDEAEVFGERFNFPRPAPSVTEPDHDSYELAWMDTSLMTSFDFDFMDGLFETDLFPTQQDSCWLPPDDTAAFAVQLGDGRLTMIAADIKTAPSILLLPEQQRQEISLKVDLFLSYDNALRFINYYWEFWHWNSRLVHRPSFREFAVEGALLASMMFLGAMYSPNLAERTTASTLLEHAASYTFSQSLFCCSKGEKDSPDPGTVSYFQGLQAGFLVVVISFWAGDERSRYIATTQYFDRVVEVTSLRTIE